MIRTFLQKFKYSVIKYVMSKVKFTLRRVMKPQRGSRRIALPFLQPQCYIGMCGQRHAPVALPTEITRYLCIEGSVALKVGLEGCRETRPHRDSIPELSSS